MTATNNFKICVLGSSGVGKTSIIKSLLGNEFEEEGQPTIGVDFKSHNILVDAETVSLQIWDTAGQERFRSISKGYFRNAYGGLLVFDVTSRQSFDDLNQWLNDLTTLALPNAVVVLIGNKTDLNEQRVIQQAEAEEFATRYGLTYIESSAKTGDGVSDSFARLAGDILRAVKAGTIKAAAPKETPQVKVAEEKSGCC